MNEKNKINKFAKYVNEVLEELAHPVDFYKEWALKGYQKVRKVYDSLSEKNKQSFAVKSDLNDLELKLNMEVTK
jgi:hypothetical protein